MDHIAILISYLERSNTITIVVLALLSLYFILINWIFFYRYLLLAIANRREIFSLETIRMGSKKPGINSFLHKCGFESGSKQTGEYCVFEATKESTKGLTFLSMAASTSPFIGLFGTVVSILETFYVMGSTKASIATISASIGEALVATAAGIFVAIFAYSYHQILKRKAFEFVTTIQMQIDLLTGK
ncbi:MAG: MotA/TolQ/ExbB proton channel family protein [Epsilonproteobacteria bacterium]|nr:MotA/TolQ/ExbB proton channel family protein [Campylobacterota bacterium]NPA64542.1 MotA/TolQ/ExbB proton channel family protein [Campylobacterota bacterium]